MKKLLIGLMLITNLTVTQGQTTQNTDGLNTEISAQELESLEDWANNTNKDLGYIGRFAGGERDVSDAISIYETEISRIVENNTKVNALVMRKYLNRAVEINKVVKAGTSKRSSKAFRLHMFKAMVQASQASYSSDIDFINGKKESEAASVLAMRKTLLGLYQMSQTKNKSVKSTVRLKMLKKIAAYINRDFFDSSYAQANAFEIRKINELLSGSLKSQRENILIDLLSSLKVGVKGERVVGRDYSVFQSPGEKELTPDSSITGNNFKKCYNTGMADNSYVSSMIFDKCADYVKNYNFINNASFDMCYSVNKRSMNNLYAIRKCIKKQNQIDTRQLTNFASCFEKGMADNAYVSSMIFDKCTGYIKNYSFINNASFNMCYRVNKKSMNNLFAIAKCVDGGY